MRIPDATQDWRMALDFSAGKGHRARRSRQSLENDRNFLRYHPRKTAEKRLQEAYEGLEKRVKERTAELTELNLALLKEIRERKSAEERLIQGERLRAIGEMSAGVAHNLNNLFKFSQV